MAVLVEVFIFIYSLLPIYLQKFVPGSHIRETVIFSVIVDIAHVRKIENKKIETFEIKCIMRNSDFERATVTVSCTEYRQRQKVGSFGHL